ncbi:uncharacterized protein LOC117591579 isoform X2 [Drosophila guanche]|uniref:uncharacterized protein LOC117591579 isoform X2 n=1 Tax=Drosophila guanche TaxID=7266 RepID=UPI001471F99B|nr:uncharacterized protein LOC117591579 isoform X2 [Drosophila guanche]
MTDTRITLSGASGLCMPSLPSHGLGSDEVCRPQLTDAPVSSSPISVFGPSLTCANGLSSRLNAERIAAHTPRRFLWRIWNRFRALFALVYLVRIISATWPPSILLLAWLYRCRLSCNGLRSDHLASGMSSVCNSTVLLEGRTIGCSWNATPPVASCSFSSFPDDISDI